MKVKDQGKCKSSWAFSAIGALEGQNFKKTGFLLDLSIQQTIDCSWLYGNHGCHGGLATNVYDYVNRERGLCSSSSYSYIGYVSKDVGIKNLASIKCYVTRQLPVCIQPNIWIFLLIDMH